MQVIAEQSVSSVFCLSRGFPVGETTAPVVKALAPLKIYHSLRCDATQLELNYGAFFTFFTRFSDVFHGFFC